MEKLHTEEETKEARSDNFEALPTDTSKKASSANVDPLPLEKDTNKVNSYKNVDQFSSEGANKAISENVEAMPTEYYAKEASSDNMMPVTTEEYTKEVRSEFGICNPNSPRDY